MGDSREVLVRSQSYASYGSMNPHLRSPSAVERKGLRLQAMFASRNERGMYFKLNLGVQRQGVVSREESLRRFESMRIGDVADCFVSAWNLAGNLVFLERLEAPG